MLKRSKPTYGCEPTMNENQKTKSIQVADWFHLIQRYPKQ